jgi:ribonuclease P protein component
VYQKGKTVRGPFCSLKYIRNQRRDRYRVAVVVSRKVHKSAVVRNRIRRRIYEIIRTQASRISAPYDIVFIVYSDQLATLPFEQLQAAMLEKLEKAGIIDAQQPASQSNS